MSALAMPISTHAARARKRVFVCAGTDWHGHPSTFTHIMKIVAETEPVIWINSLGLRTPSLSSRDLRRIWGKLTFGLRHHAPAFNNGATPAAIVEPRVLPYHHYPAVRRLNTAILERQLRPHLQRLAAGVDDIIFATTSPAAADLVRAFGATRSIYYCMDEYANMDGFDPEMVRACEASLLDTVDRVCATSLTLCASKRGRLGDTLYLPQGVDYEHFQHVGARPSALRDVRGPIIGFQGIVGSRVDLGLLEKVAQRFPHATLVTLGRREVSLAALERYPNFRHLDAVSYNELPQWAGHFDIGLIAYKHDDHTAAVNPLKLLEYLAMGQAVVSNDIPEIARHKQFVAIGRDHEEYLAALAATLARYPFTEGERAARRNYARNESWRARADTFLALCDELVALPQGGERNAAA